MTKNAMRRSGFMLLAIVLLFGSAMVGMTVQSNAKDGETEKLLRHVVLFKFKESSSQKDIEKVVEAFRGLKGKIAEVAGFEYGTDNSPEGLANGFTHAFLITFRSEKDRGVYLVHKAHLEFVEVLKPHLDKVQVIDYWAAQ